MSGEKNVEIDEDDDIVEDTPEVSEKTTGLADIEARRKLEARLEERRLSKLIQDYDFDLD